MEEKKDVDPEESERVSGGVEAESEIHCPRCRSHSIQLADPGDIGSLPVYRCRICGFEWMKAL